MEEVDIKPAETNYLSELTNRWRTYAPVEKLIASLGSDSPNTISVCGLAGSSLSFLAQAVGQSFGKPILIVTQKPEDASDLYDDLTFLLGSDKVGHFPARQILPYDFSAPQGEIMGKRISTLSGMIDNSLAAVICPVRALIEPTIPKDSLSKSRISLKTGQEADLDDLIARLVRLGFNRVPVVEEIGDFAVRGGLIDFFSPGANYPVRLEFFGDEVDTIRYFDVSTQRTVSKTNAVSVLPRREIPITQESLEKYIEMLPGDDADYVRRRYLNDPELPGLEWLSILFGLKQGHLLEYFGNDSIVLLDDVQSLKAESEEILIEGEGLYERMKESLIKLPLPRQYYHSTGDTFEDIKQHHSINRLPFRKGQAGVIDFACQPHPALGSRLDLLGDSLREYESLEFDYFIATDNKAQAERLGELIHEKSQLDLAPNIEVADLKGGFVCRAGQFAVLTDHEIFHRYHRRTRRKKFKEGVAISDYSALNIGDFVVHTDHGIARYLGLKTLQVDKRNRDCLQLEYLEKDKLYVPIEEFNRVSKYAGKDADPSLTQLGGPGWEKLKKKTKKAVELMAADLVELYARRKVSSGFAFDPDTVWLKQLEASFVYDETRDQLKAIVDVKKDMEKQQAMDRLICGDVGYGKTEVAIRAAFKAIENGKQVAVLVPTTILAQQHLQSFSERFADFPVKIEMLSRFRTRKQQLETIEELTRGKVELVIGTHRLLSKDVIFKDLGLLVVDEEHRFGVRHKEKLRQLKASVDTISMTATPIPRTLQMSMMGVRDMSIISTSPKDRLPIQTEIAEFEPAVITNTILREVDRGGQVFFVHNRVQTIDAMYTYLKKLLPNVEIGIAHGQMHERSLEGIMIGFMTKRFDVLLCTSIIESGLDIPLANTIIINRADRFGLAQLYQIRGRVGRSSRRAFAYLLTPPMRRLKADAVKRLRALEAHSDLGSGFALAMRDLEIRGAGTLLGAKQSGFIEEIGFEMYNKLLEEAIANLKGTEVQRLPEVKIEIDIETYISEQYISDRQHKVDIYRRLADAVNIDEIENIREEVIDRFGALPQSSVNLFEATAVKVSAAMLALDKVKLRNGKVNLFYKEGKAINRKQVESFRKATDCPLEFSLTGRSQVIIDLGPIGESKRLNYLRNVLAKI